MSFLRAGSAVTIVSAALFVFAVVGIAPWVFGSDPECDDKGPNAIFLIAWPIAGVLGLVAIALLHEVRNAARVAFATAILVPAVAAALWVYVVIDGVQQCGF